MQIYLLFLLFCAPVRTQYFDVLPECPKAPFDYFYTICNIFSICSISDLCTKNMFNLRLRNVVFYALYVRIVVFRHFFCENICVYEK